MKTIMAVAFCLLCLCLAGAPGRASSQEGKPKSERFAALAYLPSGAGRAMVGAGATANVDLYVKRYTTDEEAKVMAGALLESPDSLLKVLQKADSIGKITLTGRVGFYDLKLIRSRPIEGGRRIYAVGDRPIGFLEMYVSNRSTDYEFGILMLDLVTNEKGKEKGEGTLIYAAKVKVLDGNRLDIENYGVQPVRLMAVRKL